MTDPFRVLCAELLDALDSGIPAGRIRMSPLIDRARAALARWGTPNLAQVRSSLGDGPAVPESREPATVMEEPSDEELEALLQATFARRLYPGVPRTTLEIDYARAVLARWGRPTTPPAPEGCEVGSEGPLSDFADGGMPLG